MSSMVERLVQHLEYADFEAEQGKHDGKLTFVVVVPTCSSTTASKNVSKSNGSENVVQRFANESFHKMIKSTFFTKHIILKPREHGYVEGSQHLRQTRYKESQYKTSIVILQSRKSREEEAENPKFSSDEFEAEIRRSFSSRHQLELDERRLKSNTLDDVVTESSEKGVKKKSKKDKKKKVKVKR